MSSWFITLPTDVSSSTWRCLGIALLLFVGGPFSAIRLLWSYAVFLGSLILAISAYRLSPFHPLAQYPGPAIGKVTKLWSCCVALPGYKYLYHKKLHDKYGPYVRTGPNELSVIDAVAVSQILNAGGLDKGQFYEGSGHGTAPPPIPAAVGAAHAARRRVWNRAMTSSSVRDYEPMIAKRVHQLRSRLYEQDATVDLVHWFDLFACGPFLIFIIYTTLTVFRIDLMGDLSFGGGFEMMHDGKDVDQVGERIRKFMQAATFFAQIPWIIQTLRLFPQVGRVLREFNNYGQRLATQRINNGTGTKDLWYHLADEAELEKEKPTLENLAADGIVAVIAGSDTASSALSSFVWFLLSNAEHYTRLQQELDSVYTEGDDPFDVNKYGKLNFLSACINETLRLHPPLPSNGTRQVRLGQNGRNIAGRYIPEGTSVYMPAYSLHRNPDYFTYPDQFIPDRWLPGSMLEKHDKSAFIPFSLGPANCVGQKFAKLEMTMMLSVLFKSFDIRFADGFDSEDWPRHIRDYFVTTRGPIASSWVVSAYAEVSCIIAEGADDV
ncbi:cytochrome P450 [Mycena vitilis]|nr:cytochrome P450 [Mycena vitilis]